MYQVILSNTLASWQSGDAEACKALYSGSIPLLASILEIIPTFSPGGGIGRRKGLKIPRLHGRAGSIPAPGTIK